MPNLMKWLGDELETIKQSEIEVSPGGDLGSEEEEVIGKLTDPYLKKLFVFRTIWSGRCKTAMRELSHRAVEIMDEPHKKEDHDPTTCEECSIKREMFMMQIKSEFINNFFWTALRHELTVEAQAKMLAAGGQIGVLKNWEVVAVTPTHPNLKEMLMRT